MAEIFDFYVADNRTIKFNPTELILQEDNGVAVWRFRIPRVLNNIDMSSFAWWFVYVNAKKHKYSEPLTLVADTDDPSNYCTADYTIDYGISLNPGSFTFALEAINANGSGEIIEEWHTKTYSHSVIGTLQGNQAEYSETESDIISALIVQIQQKYNALVGGATPIPVASVSAMTDTSKIYLLTTDNNWYYHNGTAWVSGGLYASGIVIDPTLTQPGQAADAKVVGDKIEGVNDRLDNIANNTLTATALANTGTNVEFVIVKGQTYKYSVVIADATKSVSLRTKKDAASSSFIETIMNGGPVSNAYFTATDDAGCIYIVGTADVTLNIEVVDPKSVHDEIVSLSTYADGKFYSDVELYPTMIKGYCLYTNKSVGTTIDFSDVTANNQFAVGIFEVSAGNKFVLNGVGGSSPRLWCFTDTDKKLLSVSNASITAINLEITAQSDGYLIVNFSQILVSTTPHSCIKVDGRENIAYLLSKISEMEPEVYQFSGIDMFETIGCLGDSFTQGGMRNSDNSAWVTAKKTYPKVIAANHGISVTNFGYGGSTVKTYITSELSSVLADTAKNLYIMSWGINDAYTGLTLGTIADINDEDYTQNADTFYGNYGKIIAQLQAQFPLSRFVIFGSWLSGTIYEAYIDAAEEIAEHFGIPFCRPTDDPFFNSTLWKDTMVGTHPTQVTYTGMAYAIERLLSTCIVENEQYFRYAGLENV